MIMSLIFLMTQSLPKEGKSTLYSPLIPERSMPMQQNTFNAMIPEMQLSFPNFQDNSKNQEHFPNIYSKINVNVSLPQISLLNLLLGRLVLAEHERS